MRILRRCATNAKKMHRVKLGQAGFTFIEALLQMVVLVVFLQLAALIITVFLQANTVLYNNKNVAWELFVSEVATYVQNVVAITPTANAISVDYPQGKNLQIAYYSSGKLIRKQRQFEGHEPVLLDVKSMHCTFDEPLLHIQVEFLDGMRKERYFYVGKATANINE